MHNGKKTEIRYWGYYTKSFVDKEYKELVDSNKWSCIVVDDLTKKEFDKQIKEYIPDE
jgi:hypothetical protein